MFFVLIILFGNSFGSYLMLVGLVLGKYFKEIVIIDVSIFEMVKVCLYDVDIVFFRIFEWYFVIFIYVSFFGVIWCNLVDIFVFDLWE